MEIWKPVKHFENLYEVSNIGRVKSKNRLVSNQYDISTDSYNLSKLIKGKILVGSIGKHGYRNVCLVNEKGVKQYELVHRLVAKAFIPNPDELPCVNHKNGRKLDNRANNLEWVTYSENTNHAYKNNLMKKNNKAIIQLDKNKNKIKEYKSIKEASLIMKTSPMNIIKCCKGIQNTAKGYVWKYK